MAEPLLRTNRTGAPLEDRRALDMRTDLRELLAAPMLRGAVLAGVALPAAAQVRVPHRLGRTPSGWLVTDATVGVPAIYRVSWDDTVIVFQSTTAATVNLWVW